MSEFDDDVYAVLRQAEANLDECDRLMREYLDYSWWQFIERYKNSRERTRLLDKNTALWATLYQIVEE